MIHLTKASAQKHLCHLFMLPSPKAIFARLLYKNPVHTSTTLKLGQKLRKTVQNPPCTKILAVQPGQWRNRGAPPVNSSNTGKKMEKGKKTNMTPTHHLIRESHVKCSA